MALFKKKNKDKASTPVTPAEPVVPKPPQPVIPPDTYTLVLGLSLLFFLVAAVVLALNYYWYSNLATPPVLPLDWASKSYLTRAGIYTGMLFGRGKPWHRDVQTVLSQ